MTHGHEERKPITHGGEMFLDPSPIHDVRQFASYLPLDAFKTPRIKPNKKTEKPTAQPDNSEIHEASESDI